MKQIASHPKKVFISPAITVYNVCSTTILAGSGGSGNKGNYQPTSDELDEYDGMIG